MIITAALILFTLICLAMGLGRSWSDEILAERNSLVFADRNQDYGAYQLRKEYGHRMIIAVLGAIGVLAAVVMVPSMIAHFRPVTVIAGQPLIHVVDVDLDKVFYPPAPAPKPPATTTSLPLAKPDPEKPRVVEVVDIPVTPPTPKPDTSQTGAAPGGLSGGGKPGPDPDPGGASGAGAGTDLVTTIWNGFELQEVPEFPGGEAALGEWVRRNLDFPQDVAGSDVVYVQFVVGLDGSVSDVLAVKGKQKSCKSSAERTIRRMPKWKPARMNGHDVRCRLTLPIRFETR